MASGDLSTRFVIKAETEPIADMFVRTFQKAKNSISQAAFKKLNHLLNQKSAFEYFDQNLKDLTTPGKIFYLSKYNVFLRAFFKKKVKTNIARVLNYLNIFFQKQLLGTKKTNVHKGRLSTFHKKHRKISKAP